MEGPVVKRTRSITTAAVIVAVALALLVARSLRTARAVRDSRAPPTAGRNAENAPQALQQDSAAEMHASRKLPLSDLAERADAVQRQTAALREETEENRKLSPDERRTLALSEQAIRELEKSGNIVH